MAWARTLTRHRPLQVAAWVGAAAVVVGLAVVAARADARAVGGRPSLTALGVSVGAAFVVAGLVATGSRVQRFLVGSVGLAWFAGSLSVAGLSLHQGLLVLALLTFPAGRLTGIIRQLLAVAAVVVLSERVPQLGVVTLFATLAVLALLTFVRRERSWAAVAFPAVAAAVVATVLAFTWWAQHRSVSGATIVRYDVALLAVAFGFPLATWEIRRTNGELADRVLGDRRLVGLTGLSSVLGAALGDPDLRIELWDQGPGRYVGLAGEPASPSRSQDALIVRADDDVLARVVSSAVAVGDRQTADAVAAAVRLTVVNQRLRVQQADQVAQLEASRVRLLAAADRERERIAGRLAAEAGSALVAAHTALATVESGADGEMSELIGSAMTEVVTAAAEVQRIVAGASPQRLGDGRLGAAIRMIAARVPAEVTVVISAGTSATSAVESTLFYVCSEALTNASKHSGAAHVWVSLRRAGEELVLTVADDGRGGADPTGSGLVGLADRLAAAGGHLVVSSEPGAGTTVVALLPERPARASSPGTARGGDVQRLRPGGS